MKLRHVCASFALLAALGLVCNLSLSAGDKDKKESKKDDKTPPGFEIPKTGPEHKMLAKLAGNWNAKVKMMDPSGSGEAHESKGTMKRAVILGGRYLKEDFTGSFLGTKFQGMGLVGFDTQKKKFVNTWIDTMSTGFANSEGTFDEASKTLTSHGEEVMMGKKMKTRDVLKFVSEDEQHMEMYRSMDGKEFKVMELTFTRAKEMKKEKKEKK